MSSVIIEDSLYSSLPGNDALPKQDASLESVSKIAPNKFQRIIIEVGPKWEHPKRYMLITGGHKMLTRSPNVKSVEMQKIKSFQNW